MKITYNTRKERYLDKGLTNRKWRTINQNGGKLNQNGGQ